MISRVSIQNFKSIGEPGVDLGLKPLTLLVGPNGGGKSSILEAIAVASERRVSGRLTEFSSHLDILHKPTDADGFVDINFENEPSHQKLAFRVKFGRNERPNLIFLTEDPDQRQVASQFSAELTRKSFLISSVRGNVGYSVPARGNPDWVGVHGENLILLLALIFGPGTLKDVADKIGAWANRFGIGDLHSGYWGGDQAGSDYLDRDLKTRLQLALSSSGSKQILTIITQLFWAPKDSLLMIEEPEISLHPQAQIDVLEMFAEAIKQDGKQILATTHSHIMLQALGYAVHKGWLDRDDIAVYHLEKRRSGTKAKLLPLGKQGYIKGWVPSYTKVERQLLREWAKTLPRE